jgi:hypothetical protein|tara:strand:+ start:404 stop:1147 length:744 start_codon:yes stop_codon:yes gene_type:complete
MELDFTEQILARRGLWENIRRKKERIKRGSKERMRKPGEKGAPTKEQIERAKGEKKGEKWSQKRKRNIDCDNPKGFSQKQYCDRQKRGGAYKSEALTKKQKEKFMKLEKEIPMKDFIKRYGEKDGKAIYYGTLTKLAKGADKRIPEKKKDGTKRPKSEHSDLYTDEDPKGTIKGLGFKDAKTARQSVNIIEKSKRPHKHKVQATMAMEQRSRFAAKNAKDPETKKRLSSANKIYKAYLEKLKKRTKS